MAKKILIEALNRFGYPVALQGTMNPEEDYPETFITFNTDDTEFGQSFDNKFHASYWYFSVIIYSSDANIVNEKPSEIIDHLESVGFIAQNEGMDMPSARPTHTGWVMEFCYPKIKNKF